MIGFKRWAKRMVAPMANKYRYTELELLTIFLKDLPKDSEVLIRDGIDYDLYNSIRYYPIIGDKNIHILINPLNETIEGGFERDDRDNMGA